MILETLFKNLYGDKTGFVTVDIGGAKVVLNTEPDGNITVHNVEFSSNYVKGLLQGHAAMILGIKDPNSIMVSTQYAGVEFVEVEVSGFMCVPIVTPTVKV